MTVKNGKHPNGHRVLALLDQSTYGVLRVRARELARAGISPVEATVLFALANSEKQTTPAEISRWTLRESHSVSRLLHRMSSKGLVTRSNDLDRSNLVRVAMTAKGREAYDYSVKQESVPNPFSRLSPQEREQLDGLLRKLLQASLAELRVKRDVPYP